MYIKKDESLPPSRIRIEEEREIKKRKYDNEFKQRVQINAHFFSSKFSSFDTHVAVKV